MPDLAAILGYIAAVAAAQSGLPLPPPPLHTSIVITAKVIEPSVDQRNGTVFQQTLFSRDDQIFHTLDGGINAGQHEGGGKSIEVRRFGFNLDHGGVNGGLKVLVDNVQQNQTTQGHGQGYLGSLKSLTPELVQEVNLINGPFSAEYGDFSGLGVVHVRTRDSLPDEWTVRAQGGSFNTARGFISYSPDLKNVDTFVAYEGSATDGPFVKPLGYRRDNVTANWTKHPSPSRSWGLKFNGGILGYNSSGQIPLAEVDAGRLSPFGFLDPGDGGRVHAGTAAFYFSQQQDNGSVWRFDLFAGRSLLDMYSNFTFYLNDPVTGDGIQQHDSRLHEGGHVQYTRPQTWGFANSLFTAGADLHDNQINVGLYPRVGRTPLGVTTRANARVTDGAGYVQEQLSFFGNRLQIGGGFRYDLFRYDVVDRVEPDRSGSENAGRWQPKASVAYTPSPHIPVTLHANYGRGISSIDARSIAQNPNGPRVATTDFYQAGTSHRLNRFSLATDFFWIDRSNELVYVADDGSLEFLGPTRSYGFEVKTSFEITRRLTFNGGMTKVLNAFYRGTLPREYVDRAPHFVASAGLTLSSWRNWSGSVRFRAINRYRLDPLDSFVRATGHAVLDLSLVRHIRRNLDFNFSIDNFTGRLYYETQNYVESRPYPDSAAAYGIHATPGYPINFTVGLTFRFRGK